MKTVTLDVAKTSAVKSRALEAFGGRKQRARISFATPELLFKLMTAKRWELIRAMTGAGPITIREAARRVERDVKAVHGDVHALLNAGILRKSEDGRIVFERGSVDEHERRRVVLVDLRDGDLWRRLGELERFAVGTHVLRHVRIDDALLGDAGVTSAGCAF